MQATGIVMMAGVSLRKRIVIIQVSVEQVIATVVAGVVDYGETYSERYS